MTLLDGVLIFSAAFANVFLLGFNSKNVQKSKYWLAFVTSFGITLAQYLFVKYASTGGGPLFLTVSGFGGALGIVSAIWVHNNMHKFKFSRKKTSH